MTGKKNKGDSNNMTYEDAKNRYLFKTEIHLKDFNGEETEDVVIIREPNMQEMQKIQSVDENERQKAILEILPNCIISTTLENEKGEKMKGPEAVKFLSQTLSTMSYLVQDWLNSCPFILRQQKKKN